MKFKKLLVLLVLPLIVTSAIAGSKEERVRLTKKVSREMIVGLSSNNSDVNLLLKKFYKSENYRDLMTHSRSLIQEDCEGVKNACSDDRIMDLKSNLVNSIFGGSDKSSQGEGGWNFEGRVQKHDLSQIQAIVTDFLLLNIEKIDGHTEDAIEAIFEKLRNDIR